MAELLVVMRAYWKVDLMVIHWVVLMVDPKVVSSVAMMVD